MAPIAESTRNKSNQIKQAGPYCNVNIVTLFTKSNVRANRDCLQKTIMTRVAARLLSAPREATSGCLAENKPRRPYEFFCAWCTSSCATSIQGAGEGVCPPMPRIEQQTEPTDQTQPAEHTDIVNRITIYASQTRTGTSNLTTQNQPENLLEQTKYTTLYNSHNLQYCESYHKYHATTKPNEIA